MTTIGHVFAYQVTDRPGVWLRVIAPMDTTATLRDALLEKFAGRLLAVRNESDPTAVLRIGGAPEVQPSPTPPAASPRPADQRHRWDRLAVHHYRCRHCQIERRHWIDPDTHGWFATFTRPGAQPRRLAHTPPCEQRR